ncbi:MAG: hypothetical protein HY741_02760 [Chloroflexi bacterium]|nr:hypothetical protein [Chloroflexota bacterium]
MRPKVARAYRSHLRSGDDLVTTYEATRAGFVSLALEKNRRATPYVAEARALQTAASIAKHPSDLMKISGIEAGLLTAAGLSDKALVHLLPVRFGDIVPIFRRVAKGVYGRLELSTGV